jgi:ribonuclease R
MCAGLLSEPMRGMRGLPPRGDAWPLTSLVLRSLQQAYYSPKNIGHAGLGSERYCHFTSPIRRYPDLVCHRALLSAVGGGEQVPRGGELQELGVWTSEREREAMKIERDSDDVARCFALERMLYEQGWEQAFRGEVTGLISAGAFIAFGEGPGERPGQAPPFEGMLPVRRMPRVGSGAAHQGGSREAPSGARDWWELNEEGTILQGERSGATLRLGDPIDVRVRRVEPARGRVDLGPHDG